ncbi:9081_t:CDS:1 [Diversispora eburnea]|uniref:9081_t:CDS:1 n=1 Tax=Diversispora eburnea TaxID=1213867 RepID=A0A9N9F6Y3_9GLOM|nr:9081_t:CDS:1 [Diversispora eburnea]
MSIDYRQEAKDAIDKRDYVSAWNFYTQALIESPKDLALWCNRALVGLNAGFPELTLMDSKRVVFLSLEKGKSMANDINLQNLVYKARYRLGLAAEKLGLPFLAAREFELLDTFNSKKNFGNIFEESCHQKKIDMTETYLRQQIILKREYEKRNTKIQISGIGKGWYKFTGSYPWDNRQSERISASMLQKIQGKLDIASDNKLKAVIIRSETDNPKLQLGIKTKQDVSHLTILFEEDPFISIHNRYNLRCDYCINKLSPTAREPGIPLKYPCKNQNCKEVFCNVRCYKKAMELYHRPLCGKDINKIIELSKREIGGLNHHALFLLKLFAIAKERNINPLDIEEIKHFTRLKTNPLFLEGHLVWDPEYESIYNNILSILDITMYDLQYDFWIFITLMNMIGANVFGRTFTDQAAEEKLSSIYPLCALMNHSCCDFVVPQYILPEPSNTVHNLIQDYERRRKRYHRKGYQSYRITLVTHRNLKKGEEIFYPYTQYSNSKPRRHESLLRNFGFMCHCNQCKKESGRYRGKPIAWFLYFPGDERGKNLVEIEN